MQKILEVTNLGGKTFVGAFLEILTHMFGSRHKIFWPFMFELSLLLSKTLQSPQVLEKSSSDG